MHNCNQQLWSGWSIHLWKMSNVKSKRWSVLENSSVAEVTIVRELEADCGGIPPYIRALIYATPVCADQSERIHPLVPANRISSINCPTRTWAPSFPSLYIPSFFPIKDYPLAFARGPFRPRSRKHVTVSRDGDLLRLCQNLREYRIKDFLNSSTSNHSLNRYFIIGTLLWVLF